MSEESLVMVIHLLYRAVVAGGVILEEGLVRLSTCSLFLNRAARPQQNVRSWNRFRCILEGEEREEGNALKVLWLRATRGCV